MRLSCGKDVFNEMVVGYVMICTYASLVLWVYLLYNISGSLSYRSQKCMISTKAQHDDLVSLRPEEEHMKNSWDHVICSNAATVLHVYSMIWVSFLLHHLNPLTTRHLGPRQNFCLDHTCFHSERWPSFVELSCIFTRS